MEEQHEVYSIDTLTKYPFPRLIVSQIEGYKSQITQLKLDAEETGIYPLHSIQIVYFKTCLLLILFLLSNDCHDNSDPYYGLCYQHCCTAWVSIHIVYFTS